MSETRFTPGPWEVMLGHGGRWFIRVVKHSTPYIAEQMDSTNPANADLIAAAPDLYAALEKCARALRHYEHVFNQLYDGATRSYPAGVDAEKLAMAVLAKARGEVTP